MHHHMPAGSTLHTLVMTGALRSQQTISIGEKRVRLNMLLEITVNSHDIGPTGCTMLGSFR